MILLDTHVWVWWVQADARLTAGQRQHIADNESVGLGVSAISTWEVAVLVERGRVTLPLPVMDWISAGLAYPGVQLLDLSPEIMVHSTQLPPAFHRDPADRMLVATARILDIPILTADTRIIAYPHVTVLT